MDSSLAVLCSRTPTRPPRPPTLSQYFVKHLRIVTTKYRIMECIVHGWSETGEDEDEDEELLGAVAAVLPLPPRLAVTIYLYLRLQSHPSSRVQPRIRCRLPTRGTAASPHQTWRHASAPGQLDLDKIDHLDRRPLAPTPLGNKSARGHRPHLLLDASKALWTRSFNDYVDR